MDGVLSQDILEKKLTEVWTTVEIKIPYRIYSEMICNIKDSVNDAYRFSPDCIQLEDHPICIKEFEKHLALWEAKLDKDNGPVHSIDSLYIPWDSIESMRDSIYVDQIKVEKEENSRRRALKIAAAKKRNEISSGREQLKVLINEMGIDSVIAILNSHRDDDAFDYGDDEDAF